MIFNTDSYLAIGSTHSRCEDDTTIGLKGYNSDNDSAFSCISDGCSGSYRSYFGSMLLTKCAENRLKYYLPDESSFREKLLVDINNQRENLDLNKDCLDATLLFAQTNEIGYDIWAYGDGSILKLRHDGNIEFTLIEYPSGAPLYLNYYIDNSRFDAYKQQYGLQRKIYNYLITPNEFTVSVDYDYTGLPYIEEGKNDYKVVAVTSDGIASFMEFANKNSRQADIIEIVRQIMSFKSIKGEFIQRRMNGFKFYCEKNNIKHTDDFSIAGISFEK